MSSDAMIEQRKQTAAQNTLRITDTIAAMQRSGQPINVSSVARTSGLSPHSIRSRPDIHDQIRALREEEAKLPPHQHSTTREAARWRDMEARWKAAMGLVTELKQDNANLRRQLEQHVSGIAPTMQPELDQFQAEITRLTVELANARRDYQTLRQDYEDKEIEAETAHILNRAYVRWLNALPARTKDQYPFTPPRT